MLKFIRILLAVLSITAITLVFVDFTGTAAEYLSWLPKYQLIPALLSLNFVAIAVLVVLTLLLGRVYCSVICPLGIWQDVVGRVRKWFMPRNKRRLGRFSYKKEYKALRLSFLGLFIFLLVLGLFGIIASSFAGILDPYSSYGRIAGQIFVPAWRSGVVAIADAAADHGTYLISGYPAGLAFNVAVLVIAIISLVVVSVMSWKDGRLYCNSVCPVGTLLGFLSRFSLLKPVIDTDKCNRCGSCGRKCKSECIDTKNHKIDYSRCVVCMDCINNCTQNAISYSFRRPKREKEETVAQAKPDDKRRAFLFGATIMAGSLALKAADKATDGGLAPIKNKKAHAGAAPAVPAGAFSLANFRSHCTACQLCISRCPSSVLKPSTSLSNFMQPVMVFTEGYCRPDCTACTEVCPTGAMRPIDKAEKTAIKIGTAVIDPEACISAAYGQSCGNCARHCPAVAITMVQQENGNMRPVVNDSICIGCGSCEYHCPVGTAGQISSECAAIHVEGSPVHIRI